MLGVEPQTKLNCEVLDSSKGFEVRWAIAGKSIVTQLVSKLDPNEYMAFGLSGDERQTQMIGGDVTVAWMDHDSGKGYAEDYFLDAKSQCAGMFLHVSFMDFCLLTLVISGGRGSCPDRNINFGRNNVKLLNSAIINEFTMLTYRRPLTRDDQYDKTIYTNRSQPVIWAMGPINNKVEPHNISK